jgi:2-dehydro-3-deoxyphosphogluconate aldolase/(4S)-4-hydroxy-2-oxoglutarate aldolase
VSALAQWVTRERLVAIVRLADNGRALEVAEALCEAGVSVIEVTVEREGGVAAVGRVAAALGERALVGAGTVRDAKTARAVIDLGARLVVSPDVRPEVVEATLAAGALALPGAYTPTEVALADRLGAPLVKLFPASSGGTAHLVALRGPFPEIAFVATGGVTAENLGEWFGAGATAVALGSSLVPASGDPEVAAANARAVLAALARA